MEASPSREAGQGLRRGGNTGRRAGGCLDAYAQHINAALHSLGPLQGIREVKPSDVESQADEYESDVRTFFTDEKEWICFYEVEGITE